MTNDEEVHYEAKLNLIDSESPAVLISLKQLTVVESCRFFYPPYPISFVLSLFITARTLCTIMFFFSSFFSMSAFLIHLFCVVLFSFYGT